MGTLSKIQYWKLCRIICKLFLKLYKYIRGAE
jgi:hypothetical protein